MTLTYIITILILASYTFKEAVSSCPPESELAPYCHCFGLIFFCQPEEDDMDTWDVAKYFDKVSKFIPDDIVYDHFEIQDMNVDEFPAEAFKKMKARNITIFANNKLKYIHPDAFAATFEATTILSINHNEGLTNENLPDPIYDIFNVVRQFKNLENLEIYSNPIRTLPNNAFGSLPSLVVLRLSLSGAIGNLKKIGSKPFSGLPKLQSLELFLRDISPEDIAEDAFEGLGKDAEVSLEDLNFTKFPAKVFKQLLDNARKVVIGGRKALNMDCDNESAWICSEISKYKNIVEGFLCQSGSEFKDIFEYCEKGFQNA